MLLFFICLQIILLLFMLFHDWIPIPPFNDVTALKSADSYTYRLLGSCINGIAVLIPLLITLNYYYKPGIPLPAAFTIFLFYSLLTIGTILSWWIPYFLGSSQKHKAQFSKFKNTHHFLPARHNNVIPNTLHVILHIQVWICWIISIYFLIYHI
ncbi:hypothetical protein ACQUW5_14305 [Legionella sp. CNM-1927-20]|uniref:hypothetical protein n=1 Tax=Legionella sp. CNM-1927-20 TaxID=3422221 RepID=UPI00403ACDFB